MVYDNFGEAGIKEFVHKIMLKNAKNAIKKNVDYKRSAFIDNIMNKDKN